ncbi:MAG: glutaminyl-peptide cyclotransferase, partial [Bacteroidota bacterium]|nr:glutaminyl-peptide cyclotransferase [Bacteroidota bacterium]
MNFPFLKKIVLTSVVVLPFFFSCCDRSQQEGDESAKPDTSTKSVEERKSCITVKLLSDSHNLKLGDKPEFKVDIIDSLNAETYVVNYNGKEIARQKLTDNIYVWNTENARVGENILSFEVDNKECTSAETIKVSLGSDTKPKELSYEVKQIYPHDVLAYTQGLFFKDGFLYEATGLRGESTIRKVELESGEVIQSFAIPSEIFGEGITYYDGKIIQLSWNSGRGFVYDFKDFSQIEEFQYFGEGWGLENFNDKLYMTDGSHKIRVLETTAYTVIRTLEVYDDEGPVNYLNELEFIDGKIWANIYRHEKIAIIDPHSGKVEAYINFRRLLPMNDYNSTTDVLNGIAYDKENNR